jgi:hypothetical protein
MVTDEAWTSGRAQIDAAVAGGSQLILEMEMKVPGWRAAGLTI